MDVRFVPGVSNEDAAALAQAGIRSVAQLRAADPAAATPASGLSRERLEELVRAAVATRILTDIPGLDADALAVLLEHGITDPDALAREDADALATRTGLDAEAIRGWQGAPRAEKILLKGSVASVLFGGEWRTGVPIVTAMHADEIEAALASLDGDAVVLMQGSAEAIARVGEETFEAVPLYKERIARAEDGKGDVVEEIRIRVEEIRPRRAPEPEEPAGRGFLGRLRRK